MIVWFAAKTPLKFPKRVALERLKLSTRDALNATCGVDNELFAGVTKTTFGEVWSLKLMISCGVSFVRADSLLL